MAEMSKEEKQAFIDSNAPVFWAFEDMIYATGNKILIAFIEYFHNKIAEYCIAEGLTIPQRVSIRSGGGGK